jgi:hypothetical protein
MICMDIDPFGDIERAGEHAVRLADEGGDVVGFRFNGVECRIGPGANASDVLRAYQGALRRGPPYSFELPLQPAAPAAPAAPPPLPDFVPTIYGPVPRGLLLAYPEAFERLFSEHPEVFAALERPSSPKGAF